MAEGGNIINAQVILGDTECDLCGTYKNVIWKCGNCNETLCEQCKNIHGKSKASRHHVILELIDASQQNPGSGVFCQGHPKEVLSMYCTTCGYLICLDCIRGDHRHHQFDKITDVIEEKQKEFNSIIIHTKQNRIPILTIALENLVENQINYDQETDNVIADITSKAHELKQNIDTIRDKLIQDLEKRRKEDQKHLKETKMNLEEKLNEMRKLVKESEEAIKNLSDLRIFQKLDDIKQTISSLESIPEVPQIIPAAFVPGPFKQQQLEQMYGHIVNKSEGNPENPEEKPDIDVSIVSSFTYNSNICTMQTINPNEVIISRYGEKDIGLVNRKGKVVRTLQNNCGICRLGVTQSSDLLATTGGNLVNRLTRSGAVSVFADMSPYGTMGIHVTKDGDVLVGLSKDLTGRLVRLSPTGQTKQVIEYDNNESRLYVYPSYITENINGDIWVSDTYMDDLRVTMVDNNGRYRFTYRGPTNVKMDKKFRPRGLVHNHYGQILVADHDNNTTHLVDKDGDFLQFVLTKQDGITKPMALSVDYDGQLWVGCEGGQVVVVKYLSKAKILK